jgi:FkbM family methyltransferase
MRNPLNLLRPEYVYQPRFLFKSLWRRKLTQSETVKLSWGLPITVNGQEIIGQSVAVFGVFDLPVLETLWRLTDKDDLALDIGANIGLMSSVLAKRAKKVIAFEPLPALCKRLRENVAAWGTEGEKVTVYESAVSESSGVAGFEYTELFYMNEGLAHLSENGPIQVNTVRLDDIVDTKIGVMKVDVEGFELSVFRGAQRLFEGRLIRDIVFEEHNTPPTPVISFLEDHGYRIFHLSHSFRALKLGSQRNGQSPNYLATLDAERALARLSPEGWRVLRG